MIERETGYNTHEDLQPGECYCQLLQGRTMCKLCLDELCLDAEFEAAGTFCYCAEDDPCTHCRVAAKLTAPPKRFQPTPTEAYIIRETHAGRRIA